MPFILLFFQLTAHGQLPAGTFDVEDSIFSIVHLVPESSDLHEMSVESNKVTNLLISKSEAVQPWWLFFILIGLVILVAWIKHKFYREFTELWRAAFNKSLASQLFRQQELKTTMPGVLLLLNFNVIIGVWLFSAFSDRFSFSWWSPFLLFLFLTGMVVLCNSLKYFSYYAVSKVFPFGPEISLFVFHHERRT